MSIRRYSFVFLPILFAAILIGLPTKSQYFRPQNQTVAQAATVLTAGRNVNMVSGTTLPGGDPWLQRQNEPSVAVSTRNPLHLLAGANDYRTVDMAASEGELPGISGAAGGDAWLGIFKSFDGGESWKTTLLPGSPLDSTPPSAASPIKGFGAAADPIVRAGTNGLFYYSGIAFNRGVKGGGAFFIARFIDNNNAEGGDAIKYLDTKIISQGTSGQFIDMPRIAVDVPRLGAKTVTVDGQNIQAGNVYAAYTVFLGNLDQNVRSRIMVTRSTDCGITWSSPIKISESQHIIQGSAIAIDPTYGYVYVVFRRFKSPSETDAIFICKSTDGGLTFTKPTLIANIDPFDQPATDNLGDGVSDPIGTSFRTNSYPAIAVDNNSNVYVAWADRRASVYARIVVATSFGGASWNGPIAIDNIGAIGAIGHQVMPFLTFASGKLMAVWYDQRYTGATIDNWLSDSSSIRQTVDVRAAQAAPGLIPQFQSIQVSRYLWVYDPPTNTLYQGQWNPPNYPLFKGGTVPFHGDYAELASAPTFIRDINGSWKFNTDAPNPVFHAVWTDNRDVRPPANNDWTAYNPPSSDQGSYGSNTCNNAANTGMRNQNIYTARLTNELVVEIPGNAKPLTGLGNYSGTSDQIPRAFVVYVKNTSGVIRVLRFHILAAPASGTASFMEFNAVSQIDTVIAAYSTVARTVFVKSTNANDSATIEYYELDYNENKLPGGLSGTVVLNGDPSYPGLPPGSDLGSTEIHNPNIVNPNIVNWTAVNPNIVNPNYITPNIVNIANPNIVNPNIVNYANPNIVNRNIYSNPNIVNPNIVNSNASDVSGNSQITDVTCTVKNEGNTISAYTLKTFSKEAYPEGIYLQLLVYKNHLTPATNPTDCKLNQEQHQELLLNVENPNIVNPNIVNPNIVNPNIVNAAIENASFSLGPGEEAEVCLRVIKPNKNAVMTLRTGQVFSMESFLDSIGFATTAHAVNSDDARTVEKEKLAPKAAASKLVIGTSSLPDGKVGESYPGLLGAYGGTPPYSWSLTSGELPSGLHLNSSTGEIYGTPTTVGTSYFIVRADDSAGDFDTQRYSIYIYQTVPAALSITTTSLPNGVKGHFYGATLVATGGVWPRTWSLASGSLPPGLSLDSGGVISGTPTSTGTSNFTVRVTDGANSAVTQALNLTIDEFTGAFFTISGKVYDGQGQPLGGAVMRGLPNTPVTDANGYYQDTVPAHWTGTVIPSKANVTFSPASRTYTNISADQPNQDYNKPLQLPPSVTSFSPAPGATDVAFDANLVITFNKAISAGSGNILIKRSADDVSFETIDVASSQVTINGQVATINPNGTFASLTGYYVLIANTCFKDSVGNFYAGINDKTTWNFTTLGYCVATGPMAYARRDFNATTLPGNGKVLITGWNQQAELYDPSTGAFTSAGNTVYSHTWRSTATLLSNGKVLIAGGQNAETYAEIYDGSFNQTGNLYYKHSAHTATLLQSGKVLIAAGQYDNPDYSITRHNLAEIYDPTSGASTSTGSLYQARAGHTATLLQNGKVLIAGGLDNNTNSLKSAELYDPTSGAFTSTGDMKESRYGHTATLLSSGKVLIAGGSTGNAELYDPTSGTFSYATHSMMIPARIDHTGTLLSDGKVLLAGGFAGWGGKVTNSAEIYDPITDSFSYTSYMNSPRQEFAASLLTDGRVLLVGGWDGSTEVSSADLCIAIPPPPPPVPAGFSVSGNPKTFMNVADSDYKDSMAILAKSAKLKRE